MLVPNNCRVRFAKNVCCPYNFLIFFLLKSFFCAETRALHNFSLLQEFKQADLNKNREIKGPQDIILLQQHYIYKKLTTERSEFPRRRNFWNWRVIFSLLFSVLSWEKFPWSHKPKQSFFWRLFTRANANPWVTVQFARLLRSSRYCKSNVAIRSKTRFNRNAFYYQKRLQPVCQ